MEWLALIIPFIVGGVVIALFKRAIVWWEVVIPFAITTIVILMLKFSAETKLTHDIEYWGNYVVEADYYEDWNEYISQTCTETYACGTDAEGNTQYCTRIYDCSYVQYHSEYWEAIDNSGKEHSISEGQFKEFCKRFNNTSFVELGRNYHSDDGDMYETKWDKRFETFEFVASDYSYENIVQASNSTYNYPDPTPEEIEQYKLYSYPSISYWNKLPGILAPKDFKVSPVAQKKLDWLNGTLGAKKEVRVWIQIFENQSVRAAHMQEAYWEGGNQNELCIALGVSDSTINWCHVYSWSESEKLKTDIRYYVNNNPRLDLENLIDYTYIEVDKQFVRKPFEEFSYLTVELPLKTLLWIYGLSLVLSVAFAIWASRNEFTADGIRY